MSFTKPKVLFLCTGNSARSQMAEGLLRAFSNEFEPLSSGIEPKKLHPFAVEVMREIGIDISHQKTKNVVYLLGQRVLYVVTVCDDARKRCPKFPGRFKSLHWDVDDPAKARGTYQQRLAAFRRVRNELAANIRQEFQLAAAA